MKPAFAWKRFIAHNSLLNNHRKTAIYTWHTLSIGVTRSEYTNPIYETVALSIPISTYGLSSNADLDLCGIYTWN